MIARLWRFVSLLALLAAVAPQRAEADGFGRANVVVILVDDMGYADVGFQGCKDIPTPNLDRLARSGVRCTSGYVSHPFCSPTRAGLLTGRYQQRFGHENNPKYDPADEVAGLPTDQTTLPQLLVGARYATGLVGKWHLGAAPKFHPMKRGFSEMFGFLGGGHHYFDVRLDGQPPEYLIPLERDGRPEALDGYLTDALSREAVAFIRRHKSDPFFLYLAYNAPHTPLQVTEKYLDRVKQITDKRRHSYAAMMCAVDDGVGQVLDALAELKLDEGTLVFFLSDNGGPIGDRGNGSSNTPLRAGKGAVYEGGIRVPFVVRWKGLLAAGSTYEQPVTSLDIMPTALATAGVDLPATLKLDGVNLLPYLRGEKTSPPHDILFWRTGGGHTFAARAGQYKLVKAGPVAAYELYDLTADVGETKDLAASEPQRVEQMAQRLQAWNAELTKPLFQSPVAALKKPAAAK